jgi:hypothetical protein
MFSWNVEIYISKETKITMEISENILKLEIE